MTMVERMARAMFLADFDAYHPQFNWDKAHPEVHAKFLAMALAALRELREPTEAMIEAGRWPGEDDGPIACIQAAIDAAIAEQESIK